MDSTHLFLVRHGQSEGNAALRFGGHSETPLSALGQKQALATARYLASRKISRVYSSDLPRTMQTAEFAAKLLNLEIKATANFRERNVGVLAGLTFPEAAAQHPREYAALINREFDFTMTEGESYRQMLVRATGELNQILAQDRNERIAIFSHTGTICLLVLHLLGSLDLPEPRAVWIATRNCGVAHFEFRQNSIPRLHAVNDTRHLEILHSRKS